jgi:hypothetical protein
MDTNRTPSINILAHQAVEYLTNRYNEECLRYPLMRRDVSLKGYINANLKYAIRNIRNRNLGASSTPEHHATVLP